ncbi:HET-domain-containing protein [Annulohypoxylon moriforme]|nr:HET-domain-containing protein [Annulohypoxylon moriforme]
MLCQVCKDRLESIGKPTLCCLVDGLKVKAKEGISIHKYLCVLEKHPFGHHPDEASFARSVEQGCVVCSDVPVDGDQEVQKNGAREHGFFTTFILSCSDYNRFSMTVQSNYGSKMIELIPVKIANSPILNDTLNFDLYDSTDSPQTWSTIFNWMMTCSSTHTQCKNEIQGSQYKPTRLLKTDFRNIYSREAHTFQLVRGDECPGSSPYVTLSYRWGDKSLNNTLRLLKTTSGWLQKPNPIKRLPKTLRDAMYIAYRFGIQYIWIDRLCIYQDSPEDWREEAGTMRDVYRNASLCISALSAEDDEGGCLFTRNTELVVPTLIKLNGEDVTFRADLEDTAWCTSFQNEPLLERGWILQERLMSPRTIHFGKKQVFWECAELHACETHPRGFEKFPHDQQDEDNPVLWKQLIATPTIQRTASDYSIRIFASWSAAISLYSSTKLTESNDKLVAVSGLAQDMKKALQQYTHRKHWYLAGLWEDVLIETLIWYVRVGAPANRPINYRAPSWSWASLDGHIIMPDKFFSEITRLSHLLSSGMEFLGEDDTREVKHGMLTLRGPICLIGTGRSADNQYEIEAFRRLDDQRLIGYYDNDQDWLSRPTVIFDTIGASKGLLFCLWMVTQPAMLRGWQASGIALHKVEGNAYQRDGIDGFIDSFTQKEVKII